MCHCWNKCSAHLCALLWCFTMQRPPPHLSGATTMAMWISWQVLISTLCGQWVLQETLVNTGPSFSFVLYTWYFLRHILCNPGLPGTHCEASNWSQTHTDSPASAYQLQGIKLSTTVTITWKLLSDWAQQFYLLEGQRQEDHIIPESTLDSTGIIRQS